MSIVSLVWNYLKAKPLNTALNVVLLALGIAVITLLLLFTKQLEQKITQNTKSIALVVGAKGSPMQLILCNIFHIDFPTGNINLAEAEKIARNRMVKKAVPLALGDSYQGYRIVGTNTDYVDLYQVELLNGNWWKNDLEVVVGFTVANQINMHVGDTFTSTHGLVKEGGAHDEQHFVVKGILKESNTVVDNLILTSVESIWHMHEAHGISASIADKSYQLDSTDTPSRLVPSVSAGDSTKEITAMLLQYRSPMGAIQLPRLINSQSSLQAASPAFETARLFSILGIGVDIVMGFAYVLILISVLSIFIALYNSLNERRYDLAIMRSMGATPATLFKTILLEGSILTVSGGVIGLLMGHGTLMVMTALLEETQKMGVSSLIVYTEEGMILVGSLLLGLLCSLIPAIQAYRTDISKVLAGN